MKRRAASNFAFPLSLKSDVASLNSFFGFPANKNCSQHPVCFQQKHLWKTHCALSALYNKTDNLITNTDMNP